MSDSAGVDVDDFPDLDDAAKQRIQDALTSAIEQELLAAGKSPTGVFGDGSVKSIVRDRV